MIIDVHCHAGSFALVPGKHTPEDLIAEHDRHGIDVGVFATLRTSDMAGANAVTAELCDRFPGRLVGHVYVNPTDVDGALAQLGRYGRDDRFRGVKLHPSNDTYFPFVEAYYPVYERIEALGLPMLVHSGTSPYSHPLAIAHVARRFPGVPVILAHFGLADLSWECFPAAELAPNVHVDTAGNPIVTVMDDWIEQFGPERMLWGSDFPWYRVGYELAKVDHLSCDAAAKALIRGGNAQRIYRL